MTRRLSQPAWVILTDKHEADHAQFIVEAAAVRGLAVRLVSIYPRTMSDADAGANAIGIVLCLHQPRWPQLDELFKEIARLPLLGGKGVIVAARRSRYDAEFVKTYFTPSGIEPLMPQNEYMAAADVVDAMERIEAEAAGA